eukprot:TRINITY_DN1877_c1_g1_i6.p1 TRINITY_DN1877_c1_g1~~TRINITY_DN1877_c1_g1_i6.p1  ORF type:complete len:166 (-),score=22.82 TRINITY_DN1877_c1_g1_i6:337-834(-)
MEALPWAQTLEIPELAPLVSTLESAGMLRHVEFIIGTNLALLIELQARLQAAHENPVEIVTEFLLFQLDIMGLKVAALRRQNPELVGPLQQIAQGAVPALWGSDLPAPCKVLLVRNGQVTPVNATARCAIYWKFTGQPCFTKDHLDQYVEALQRGLFPKVLASNN